MQREFPETLDEILKNRLASVRVTQGLILANLLVFVASLAAGAGFWHSPNAVQLAWGANFGPATQDGQWWRLASALFLHFGALHLLVNLWALWDGAQFVERFLGSGRFAVLYFAAGLCGNLLSLTMHGRQAVSGGASSAIFGVYGALFVCLWAERAAIDRREFRWWFWGAASFAAATFAFGAVVSGIDQAAHLGGFVAGVVLGFVLRRNPALRAARSLAAAGLAMACLAIILSLPRPNYRWREEAAARQRIGAFLRQDVAIRGAWQDIRRRGSAGASFDELAGRIEREIAGPYEDSFEQLSRLHLDPAAPSAAQLEALRRYAAQQRQAAAALARGLREEATGGGERP